MKSYYSLILDEIAECLETSDYSDLEKFVNHIKDSNRCITYGAGRVGLVMKSFAKRLGHLGKPSFFLEDTTVPNTGSGDLLILGSGSGSTASVVTIAKIASMNSLNMILITAQKSSELRSLASSTIFLHSPSKLEQKDFYGHSKQPMTSLFEQALGIFCDSLVLNLMDQLGETEKSMKARHNVLE